MKLIKVNLGIIFIVVVLLTHLVIASSWLEDQQELEQQQQQRQSSESNRPGRRRSNRYQHARYQPHQDTDDQDNQEDENNGEDVLAQQIARLEEAVDGLKDDGRSSDDDESPPAKASTSTKTQQSAVVVNGGGGSKSRMVVNNSDGLSKQTGSESNHSWALFLFFILCILGFSILLLHVLIKTKFHFLPESVAIVFLGASIGLLIKMLSHYKITDWSEEEKFTPTMFFLILLPPIIFESGYNLHKGNFFQNIGSILVFAIFGTAISAFVMGTGVYLLGKIGLTFSLDAKESYAFGSLVSAVDPVATLAIFNALDIDPVLYMLVFGESILNDAVAIVLTNTITTLSDSSLAFFDIILFVISRFFLMFFASAGIGCLFGIVSAILFKYVDLRKTPSLETAFMLIFMYSPYVFAEAIKLSGIMAILFAGIVMSHYTHYNLSPVTRITVQQVFRTLAFIAETCVFAYLGLAIFSFKHSFKPSLVISSIIMCLVGRACNIFPLATLLNYFREHKITKKMQFIMWFSGLRGAIAFALSLNLQIDDETRHVIVTSTLILVLFTTLFLGGSTLPLMKFLNADKNNRRKKKRIVFLSKTKEMGEAVDLINLLGDDTMSGSSNGLANGAEALPMTATGGGGDAESGDVDDVHNVSSVNIHIVRSGVRLKGFARLDETFLKPFFTRKFTDEELRDGQSHMNRLTKQWFDEVNTDALPNPTSQQPSENRVYFKKSNNNNAKKNNNTGSRSTTKLDKGAVYHNLNSSSKSSNVLLESTDDEDEYNSDEEDVVIDKQQIKTTLNK